MATKYQKFIGGLLGENVEGMSEEERKRLAREGTLKTVMGFLGGRGLLGGITEYKQEREGARRKAAAEDLLGRMFAPPSAAMPEAQGSTPSAGTGQPVAPPPAGGPQNAGALPVPSVAGAPQTPSAPRLPGAPQNLDFQSMARIMLTTQEGRDLAKMNPELFQYVMENAKPKEEKMSSDYSDYLRAVNAGDFEGTFLDWQIKIKTAGAPRVSVPVNLGDKASEVTMKPFVDQMDRALTAADNAENILSQSAVMLSASKSGTYTGALAPGFVGVTDFLRSFNVNVDPKTVSNTRAFQAASNQLVLAFMTANGGAKGFTESEIKILQDAFPRIADSVQAREIIISVMQGKAKKDIDKYNRLVDTFNKKYPDAINPYDKKTVFDERKFNTWLGTPEGQAYLRSLGGSR